MPADINREQYLGLIEDQWPDREGLADSLADWTDTLSREWPPVSRQVLFSLLAKLGLKVAQANSPEDCLNAFEDVLRYLECPEPSWA